MFDERSHNTNLDRKTVLNIKLFVLPFFRV